MAADGEGSDEGGFFGTTETATWQRRASMESSAADPPIVDGGMVLTPAQMALLVEALDWRRTVAPEAASGRSPSSWTAFAPLKMLYRWGLARPIQRVGGADAL